MELFEKDTLYVGNGRADITPHIGTLLYGYRPDVVSTSIHDQLNITAIAFRESNESAVLLTATVGDIQTELSDEVRKAVSNKCGIPFENVFLSATHTHSAPNVSGSEGWGEVDRSYVDEFFLPGAINAAKDAVNALQPAELSIGTTESKVAINRRQQLPNGDIGLGQNPWKCFDPNMTVIAFRNKETKAGIINLIHYGCHGTCAGMNHEISRDWSGIMCDRLETLTGTMTAFWNGAIGDTGPRLTNGSTVGDIHYVEELGGVAAQDAIKAYNGRGTYREVNMKLYNDVIKLPYKPLESFEDVKKALGEIEDPDKLVNIQRMMYFHLKEVFDYYNSGNPEIKTSLDLPTTILTLGDVCIIPIPFEVFSEISLRLRAYLSEKYKNVLIMSNTNGYYLYLPTEDELCLGGYEVLCFLNSGLFLLENNTDQHFIDESIRILNKE